MTTYLRIWLEGELTLETPLHLGSGGAEEREGLVVEEADGGERQAEVSAVVTDHRGRAYLPGRAVKGALRSWLAAIESLQGSPLVEQLLGTEEIRSQEERGETLIFGGKAQLWNAFVSELPTFEKEPPPFWHEKRATAVRASVALDRRTRTVAGDRLFFEEFVPPGTKFLLRASADKVNEAELRLLLFALSGFNHEAKALTLGAGGADGNGRFTWKLKTLRALTAEQLAAWITSGQAGHESLPEVEESQRERLRLAAESAWPRPAAKTLEASLALTFDTPFLVAAPRRKREEEKDKNLPDHVPLTDVYGRPLLPASSLRGALRHRAEKILRTLGVRACRPESKGKDGACKPITQPEQARDLCPACRLFGAPGWGTLLVVSDFTQVATHTASPQTFEHLAIDRFTGGVSGSLKFNTQAFVGAKLEGTLRLEQSARAEAWMPGLLALVLRDLVQGDLPLGFGSSKGYGACHGEVRAIRGEDLEWREPAEPDEDQQLRLAKAVEVFHQFVSQNAKPLQAAQTELLSTQPVPDPPQLAPSRLAADAFHNPYQFVPLQPGMDDPEKVTAGDFAAGKLGALSHERFQVGEGFFSGQIELRVRTETPTVVGDKHTRTSDNEPAVVTPFELDGKPALPGASLRGLLSSLAEAATGSAMRVLEDRSLSYRMAMKDSLPALGRLVDVEGRLMLEPLALPAYSCDPQGRAFQPMAESWQALFPEPRLRIYVNGYKGLGKEGVKLLDGSFLKRVGPDSASSDHPEDLWYYPLGTLPTWDAGRPTMAHPHVKETRSKKGDLSYQVVAQDRDPSVQPPAGQRPEPIPRAAYEKLTEAERAGYVPGILRVLDIEGHEKEIPSQRTHEIFLPLPDPANPRPRLEAQAALDEFRRLADERTGAEKHLPFTLKGKSRVTEKGRENLVRLKAGDVVFFKPDPSGKKVAELALSSIWRKGAGTVFQYVDEELRPFHPGRKHLSIAERVFGFVEQGLKEAGVKRPALGLASRVRFGFGRLEDGQSEPFYEVEQPVALAILGSPKPPAPALYFRDKNNAEAAILKRDLKPQRHQPQGRKVYLHQPAGNRWRHTGDETERASLRSKAKPLKAELTFTAHLDFDNLSERDLALLLYVLRPTEAFRHLLGMGKPLGLGRVEVTPVAVRCVDRRARYGQETDLLNAPRWHQELGAQARTDLVGRFRAAMPAELRWAFELVGHPASVAPGSTVSYPRTADQKADAEEGFKWFVENQKPENKPQQLRPIVYGKGLPTLNKNHAPQVRGGGPGGHQPGGGSQQRPARPTGGAPAHARPTGRGGASPNRREDRRDRPQGAVAPLPPPKAVEAGKFEGGLADQLKKALGKG